MRCPKCNSNVYSHHQKINESGTEIKRDYACRKCKYVFKTIELIIIDNSQYIDYLMDDILSGKHTMEEYSKELEDSTGIIIKCKEE